jgi:cytochrome P450
MDRKIAPGRRQLLPLAIGILAEYSRSPIRFLTDTVRQYGDVVRAQIGTAVLHLITHPRDVQSVFQDRAENYPRSWLYYIFEIGVGKGVLSTKGETWRQQRATLDPAFAPPQLAAYVPLATEATAAMLGRWQPLAQSGQPVNMTSEMMRLTLQFLSRLVLGVDLSGEGDERGQALATMQQYMNRRIVSRWPSLPSLPTPGNLRLHRALRLFDHFVYALIAERRRNPGPPTNLVEMMVTGRDPQTGQQLSDQQLRDNIMAFFMAGHETLAQPLAWAWYHLSRSPALRQQLHEEATRVLGGRPATLQDLPQLRFAQMVVQETLRLYPSVWVFTRQAVQDDELGGFFIPAGSIIVLCPFLTHRHATFWPNHDTFDPARFAPERSAGRHPFAYCPFAGGPHRCIGDELAMIALSLMMAMIAQSYLPQLVNDIPIEPKAGVTVRPGGPVMMTVRKMDNHSSR